MIEFTFTSIFYFILQSIYFILPGIFANMIPPLVKNINFLNKPIDFGINSGGNRIFGDHKTWRGMFFGIFIAIIIAGIQYYLYIDITFFRKLSLIDFELTNFILFGALIGFGVIFGDMIESFFKRRKNIAPGKPWFPWDQLDALLGGMLFCFLIFIPPWTTIVFLIILVPSLHLLINRIAYWTGLQKNKY